MYTGIHEKIITTNMFCKITFSAFNVTFLCDNTVKSMNAQKISIEL